MYSCPDPISTGRMCPGTFVAKDTSPRAPSARYSVMNRVPPPATRRNTPKIPPPPPNWVCVVIWIELVIQESSPASEIMDSFGSSATSRTGMVVPTMRLCMTNSLIRPLLCARSGHGPVPAGDEEFRVYNVRDSKLRSNFSDQIRVFVSNQTIQKNTEV